MCALDRTKKKRIASHVFISRHCIVRFEPQKPSLFGETLEGLTKQIEAAGHKGFRAKQVMDWLYKKRVDSWDAMSNLPKDFRAWLDENFILYPTAPVIDKRSTDVTQNYCWNWRISH